MKKLLALALVMVLALSLLTACGGNSNSGNSGSSNTPSSTPSGNNTTTPPASNGGNETPQNNNSSDGNIGGFKNSRGDPLTVAETAPTIEEAVGVSVEGRRIVRKYSETFFEVVWKPDGCTVIYVIYEFDAETGKVSDCSMWYGGFTDEALFSAAFQKQLETIWETHLRGYNVSGKYYGSYAFPAIPNNQEDGVATWDDAMAYGDFSRDKTSYIWIE